MKQLLIVLLFSFSFSFSQELIPPSVISAPSPEYPLQLKKLGIEGVVQLTLLVNELGIVERCSLITPLDPVLDSLSIEAANEIKFVPAKFGDKPVAVELPYEFYFSLDDALNSLRYVTRIKGVVSIRGSRNPLTGVEVRYTPTDSVVFNLPRERVLLKLGEFPEQWSDTMSLITKTDSLGRYYFRGVPNGEFKISIYSDKIATYHLIDTLEHGPQLQLDINTTREEYNDYVIVSRYRQENEISERNLTAEDLGTVAGASGDPVNAIRSLPGVAKTQGGSQLILRGARPEDTQFYLNDIPTPFIFHQGGVRSIIPSEILSDLAMYPSAFGAYYGNGIGGVVAASSNTESPSQLSGAFDVSNIDFGGYLDIKPNEDIRITAGGRLSDRTGIYERYITELLGNRGVIPTYRDYFASLKMKFFQNHTVNVSLVGAADSLVIPYSTIWDPELSRSFNQVSGSWDWKINRRSSQKFIYSYTFNSNKRKQGIKNSYGRSSNMIYKDHYFRLMWDRTISPKCVLSFGVNSDIRILFDYEMSYDTIREAMVRSSSEELVHGLASPWVELSLKPIPSLTMILGSRYDYYPVLNYQGSMYPSFLPGKGGTTRFPGDPSVRFSARYKISGDHIVKIGMGNYNQTPKPDGIVLDSANGNPYLPTTKAVHYTAGYECEINDNFSFDVEGYFNSRWSIPYEENSEVSTAWIDSGEGRSYGLEVLIRRERTERFSGWLSYTLSKTEEKTVGDYTLINYDQTHNLQFVGTLFLPKKWELSARAQVTSGNPSTPLDSVTTITSDTTLSYLPHWGDENSIRLKTAVQLDLRISKFVRWGRVSSEIYLDIQNALYPVYKTPEYKEFNGGTGEYLEYYSPIIPSVGIKLTF